MPVQKRNPGSAVMDSNQCNPFNITPINRISLVQIPLATAIPALNPRARADSIMEKNKGPTTKLNVSPSNKPLSRSGSMEQR